MKGSYILVIYIPEVNEITIAPVYIDSITVELNGYVPEEPICIS